MFSLNFYKLKSHPSKIEREFVKPLQKPSRESISIISDKIHDGQWELRRGVCGRGRGGALPERGAAGAAAAGGGGAGGGRGDGGSGAGGGAAAPPRPRPLLRVCEGGGLQLLHPPGPPQAGHRGDQVLYLTHETVVRRRYFKRRSK